MALAVKRAGAAEYGQYIKMLVVGDPGSGKTRTASTWPDVLYASAEAGLMSVSDRQPPFVEIKSSDDLLELLRLLQQKPEVREKMLGVPVRTLVVDTIDEMARILVKERLESEKKSALAIQDWGWLGEQLRSMVRAMRNLDMHVIFNVHVKSSEDSETGRTYFKPSVQGAMSDEIAAYVDLALLLTARPVTAVENGQTVKKIVRFFQTHPDPSRPWVKDRSGKLPMEFEVNFNDDFDRLFGTIYSSVPAEAEKVNSALPASPAPGKASVAVKKATAPKPEPVLPEAEVAPPADVKVAEQVEEPQPVAEESSNSPAPAEAPVEETVAPDAQAEVATEPAREPWRTCQGCGGDVEKKDQADLAFLRYRKILCRQCFADEKAK